MLVALAAATSTTSGTALVAAFDTETDDTDTMFSTATPTRLTAKTAGAYATVVYTNWASNATGFRTVSVLKNGAVIYSDTRPAATGAGTLMAFSVPDTDMAVNDYLEVRVLQNSGAALNVNNVTASARWVGQ